MTTAKSDAKHTPGPWTINPASPRDHHRDSVIVDDAGNRLALVRGQDVVDSIHVANSLLIAAAPNAYAIIRAEYDAYGGFKTLPVGYPADRAKAIVAYIRAVEGGAA